MSGTASRFVRVDITGRAGAAVDFGPSQASVALAERCAVAEAFLARARGLIGRRGLGAGEGMLFPRCNNVHMWFMRIPIDIVFIRRGAVAPGAVPDPIKGEWTVSSLREGARPWRPLPLADFGASETIELPAGAVRAAGLRAGDKLCIS